jgi:phage-related protein (TIGR01555 family)
MAKKTNMILNNGLEDLVSGVAAGAGYGGNSDLLSQPYTLANANAYTPLTLNRILLSYSYMTLGLVQTLIDQPVEDAFRGGITLSSPEMTAEECRELVLAMDGEGDISAIKRVGGAARLFGGGGLLVNTEQDYSQPLGEIKQGAKLQLISADRWELLLTNIDFATDPNFGTKTLIPYNYYGKRVHYSRVVKMLGREAPSFIRIRLQGWGMSEVERCIRSINAFVKFQSVVFELIDEAKIDVFSMEGFNVAMGTPNGTALVQKRIQLANMLKNYKRALVMDKEDDYKQKVMSFAGIAEIWAELRLNLASDLKMPMTKLFGLSAEGFSTGAEDIENYNSIVESDVRHKIKPLIVAAAKLRCQQRHGYEPELLTVHFKPLRILDATEEEAVNKSKTERTTLLFDRNLLSGQEAMQVLRDEDVVRMDTEVGMGKREPEIPGADEPAAEKSAPAKKK